MKEITVITRNEKLILTNACNDVVIPGHDFFFLFFTRPSEAELNLGDGNVYENDLKAIYTYCSRENIGPFIAW